MRQKRFIPFIYWFAFIFYLLQVRCTMALNIAKRSILLATTTSSHTSTSFTKSVIGKSYQPFGNFIYKLFHRNMSNTTATTSSDGNNAEPIKSVIICGPSGVGKGTMINKLLHDFPNRYALSVSHTSRAPRPGEVDGVHYHFVDKEFMLNDIQNGPWKYLEHAQVHGNLYGTREDAVRSIHETGKICVLDLDTCGVKQLKASKFPVKLMFIAPPSMSELEARLRGRGTEKEEQILTRVKNAEKELEFGLEPGNVDVVLTNDDLEQSYAKLVNQLDEWFPVK